MVSLLFGCHPEQSEGPAFALVLDFLSVIPLKESALPQVSV
jgi:hypothetical protein